MRNQRGLTLLEILVAVAILSGVVIASAALITSSYRSSSKEERKDISVDLAKTVLEEIKLTLKNTTLSTTTITTLNSKTVNIPVNLALLRQIVTAKNDVASFSFTDSTNHVYQVVVSNMPYTNQILPVTDPTDATKTYNFDMSQFFSLVQVQVTQTQLKVNYVLQTYMEKR